MDNQNQVQLPKNLQVRKNVWPMVVALVILVALIGAWFVWNNYLSPSAQRRIELEENYEKATSVMKIFEETMRADTYGGKTPQETLEMFINALKKGDIELASKYFILDTNIQSPDYLTRRKWEIAFSDPNLKPSLSSIADRLMKAVPDIKNISTQSDYKFAVYKGNGDLDIYINMELNKYSQVWKIESM